MSQAMIGVWPCALPNRVGDAPRQRDIDQAVGRIGRRLDEDHRDAALLHRLVGSGADDTLVEAVGKAHGVNREARQRPGEQRLGAAVERLRMQDHVARPREGQHRGRDRRHAGGEQRAALGALVDRKPVLDDLAVRMIEARIDQPRSHAFRRLAPARDKVEKVLAVLGGAEHEGRGQEHGRFDGALRQLRIVAVVQHLGFRMQQVIADMGFGRKRFCHGRSPVHGPPRWRRFPE
ncbi:hypothetical protein ABIF56_003463 [Bradyrhizobium elkanii]